MILGLLDDEVWAEGLLVFYEIFRYLEGSMERLAHTNVGRFYHQDLLRTQHFEKDLQLYFGPNWKTKMYPRKCVQNYIVHLQELEKTDPDLIIAYIYHLYLGLLSGGRILRKKQKIIPFSKFYRTSFVVDFNAQQVTELKTFLKGNLTDIVSTANDDLKKKLLDESITVFKLNCDLIRSIDSANITMFKIIKLISFIGVFIVLFLILYLYLKDKGQREL